MEGESGHLSLNNKKKKSVHMFLFACVHLSKSSQSELSSFLQEF